ncbi:hypothetical protein GJAV_G00226450 [Gymnothorax javanicus]|nr:hypothetical protein GJAV_G00226450 [Gymnothorax javanicus]
MRISDVLRNYATSAKNIPEGNSAPQDVLESGANRDAHRAVIFDKNLSLCRRLSCTRTRLSPVEGCRSFGRGP